MADPRPGLSDWLRSNRPPAMVWAIRRLEPLTRAFVRRFGWDEYGSACLLATVEAWDKYDPSLGEFRSYLPCVVGSHLRDQLKAAGRLRRTEPDRVPLATDDRSVDPDTALDDRDEVAVLVASRPELAATFAAVMECETVAEAAVALGQSRQTLHKRLSRLKRMCEETNGSNI